ncbi:dTDP-glucose 4,6-dehydratase 2 [Moorella thermoacetica]|uniref:dTDP-glucose 4,6-dehydratase n=1 Tax=Neomoorella thermoacetica TaxID=1525 RepID=A0AAC9MTB2_NEOTH|nr:dTDP-glucose 4,6-dehydratase [Moorella thermoacetica]AOQ23308.1 dTDP-glucose 4,6-dehydratase 2 [Moorella thermoacetica]TYL13014.1 dTDP-glucose 4,6-dehydratase 2 [Moorella thermoacetica]
MVKLLVTGGAGFIGSNFIRHLLKEHPDWYIVNLDKLTYAGNLENLKDVEDNPRYRFVRGDIADRELVDHLFREEKFDLVANLAAESHVDRSILDPAPFLETNVKGTQVLLEAARQHGIRKFLQVSTDEVYGSLGPDDPPFTEESPIQPNSPYSASKAAADLLCRAYFRTYGVPVVITRCSNNYGPYQHPEKFIPTIILNALADKPIPVYGDGQNVRDWIHVEDHCRALDLVLQKGQAGEVYNIGAKNEHTNLDIVKTILRLMNKPESLITFVKDRPGHDRRYAIEPSKIEAALSWQPLVDFTSGLKDLITWYIEHRPWWERVKSGEYRMYAARWYGSLVK